MHFKFSVPLSPFSSKANTAFLSITRTALKFFPPSLGFGFFLNIKADLTKTFPGLKHSQDRKLLGDLSFLFVSLPESSHTSPQSTLPGLEYQAPPCGSLSCHPSWGETSPRPGPGEHVRRRINALREMDVYGNSFKKQRKGGSGWPLSSSQSW